MYILGFLTTIGFICLSYFEQTRIIGVWAAWAIAGSMMVLGAFNFMMATCFPSLAHTSKDIPLKYLWYQLFMTTIYMSVMWGADLYNQTILYGLGSLMLASSLILDKMALRAK